MIVRTVSRTLALAAVMLSMVACSPDRPAGEGPGKGAQNLVGKPAEISHIHGLGLGPSGALFVATHFGLITSDADGRWVYASADTTDHMGFSIHPRDGSMVRSGHSQARPVLGVESSRDGARWTHLSDVTDPPVDFHAMTVGFADAATLWGSDAGGRGLFRSTDGGTTWTKLEAAGIERQIYVLAGTAAEDVVYAGTATGLYRSADAGDTWRRIEGIGRGWAIGIASDPADAGRLLVFAQTGMKRSRDGGKTWDASGRGLPRDIQITSLAINPADTKIVFAADSSRIYKSVDGGETWSLLHEA